MGWFGGDNDDNNEPDQSEQKTLNKILNVASNYVTVPDDVKERWEVLQFSAMAISPEQKIILGLVGATSFVLGLCVGRLISSASSPFKRITSVHQISTVGPESRWLRGRVVSVSDGDTFRLYHVPTRILHSSRPPDGAKLSEVAIPVRVCTIDTPETAKFGKPGQPFGDEAKQHLSDRILDKMIYVQLLTKDQYGRAVAQARYPTFLSTFRNRYVDEMMLRAGLAEVYTGGGAVYGYKGKEEYMKIQERAKKSKAGIWSDPNRETAAEYKARTKEE